MADRYESELHQAVKDMCEHFDYGKPPWASKLEAAVYEYIELKKSTDSGITAELTSLREKIASLEQRYNEHYRGVDICNDWDKILERDTTGPK